MYKIKYKYIAIVGISLAFTACKIPTLVSKTENKAVPAGYSAAAQDTTNSAKVNWKTYFSDPYLRVLIDTAIKNNQELNITLQEIEIARNEVRARKGEYLPFVGLRAGAGVDKAPRYTNIGALEANTELRPGEERPEPLPDYLLAVQANWEVDIWKKLRTAKKAALNRYVSSVEGRNFVITNLVAEVASSYYELIALDNQLLIVNQNIELQNNALKVVRLQMDATRVTLLAVRKFEAEVLNTTNLQYAIKQRIRETENRINFLLARYPQPIQRDDQTFNTIVPQSIMAGVPSQLLINRPDVRQAELDLAAAKLDIAVAKTNFYPRLDISASVGYQAFNPKFLFNPASILYSVAGELTAPLINRNAIKAAYYTANAKQIQAIYTYERTVLNAYIEVANQLSNIENLSKSYDTKSQEVQKLTESINISNNLFRSARADYMEVLLTQRDALESRFDLVETKMKQMNAMINIYHALGGGWN
jgi:NodT family efflux transporter outer membrane factor (OMF) lipoprotein